MDTNEKAAALAQLNREIEACTACELHRTRTRAVPGEGNPDARIMFIGEGPGYYEDQQGRPFVGPAGQFLDQLLASINQRRQDVFIANVIKSRPPNNRDPLPSEIAACKPWLDRQQEIIQPKVVVTLGRYSMARYFPGESIGRIHGQPRRVGGLTVVPMYHPAAALHQASLRKTIETDFKKLPEVLASVVQEESRPREAEPQQRSLF